MTLNTNLEFEPPGIGSWTLDNQHYPTPMSQFKQEFGLTFARASVNRTFARYGILTVVTGSTVHGFSYNRVGRVGAQLGSSEVPDLNNPAVAERIERARQAYHNKSWQQDLVRWDTEIKPDSIARNLSLASIDIDSLDHDGLIEHLHQCRTNMGEMMIRHHMFTNVSTIPLGLFLMDALEWTGLDIDSLYSLLDGASPVSTGATPEFVSVVEAIRNDPAAVKLLSSGRDASSLLTELRDLGGAVGKAVTRFLLMDGHRSTSGFDLQNQCAIELPGMLIARILSAVENGIEDRSTEALEAAAFIRQRVPEEHRQVFDEELADARNLFRLKDERGIYNDIWATGITRLAILAAGRKLVRDKTLSESEHLIEATWGEIQSLLRGIIEVTDDELAERGAIRMSRTWRDAPPSLGPPPTPPAPVTGLPWEVERMNRASVVMRTAMTSTPATGESTDLTGTVASKGLHEGRARIAVGNYDLSQISPGDVLVTSTHSEAFNAVAGQVGAIVADTGGILSHLSIVSRELGIPCIVACKNATTSLKEGSLIRVDANTGVVTVLND